MPRPPKRPEGRGKTPRPRTDTGGQRPREDRPRDERPRSEHPRGARPRSEPAQDDRTRADGPRADKPRGNGPRGDRPHSDRPHGNAPRSEAPRREASRGEAPRDDRPRRAPPRAAAPKHAEPTIETSAEPPRPGAGAGSGAYWIYGQHAVIGALTNPLRKPRRLLTTAEAETALRERFSGPWRVTPERAERSRFGTFLPEDAVHQGIALLAEPLEPVALEDAIEASGGPVLLLDQVTDPRNVGAALRAAAAFGAAAVVLQDRHAPPETGALARAASGTLDIVPVVREVNLSRAIATLQKHNFWVMGLAGEATRTLAEAAPRDRRVALVLGAEDSGLRRLQRETCDELVRLPMAEGVESLNVSAAAAVALYEIVRR